MGSTALPLHDEKEMTAKETTVQTEDQCSHLTVRDVNCHLICNVCQGYLIDATTITECLHSFCRSCIVQHVEKHHTCPACQVALSRTKPYSQLRRDHTLQSIVYKMVPHLARTELHRRQQFRIDNHLQGFDASSLTDDRFLQSFFAPSDPISLSLEYANTNCGFQENIIRNHQLNRNGKPGENDTQQVNSRRYYRCPAALPVGRLMNFLRWKYEVMDRSYEVEILYNGQPLLPEYKLSDVAYIFSWTEKEPLKLWYRFVKTEENVAQSHSMNETSTTANGLVVKDNAVKEKEVPCKRKRKTGRVKCVKKVKLCQTIQVSEKKTHAEISRHSVNETPSPAVDSSQPLLLTDQVRMAGKEEEEEEERPVNGRENSQASDQLGEEPGKQVKEEDGKAEPDTDTTVKIVDENKPDRLTVPIPTDSNTIDEPSVKEDPSSTVDQISPDEKDAPVQEKNSVENVAPEPTDIQIKENGDTLTVGEDGEKAVKPWLPKAVFDLDDRALLAKRLQRDAACSDEEKCRAESKMPSPLTKKEVTNASPNPSGLCHSLDKMKTLSPVSVSVTSTENGPISPSVVAAGSSGKRSSTTSPARDVTQPIHDSIGALDLSGRSSDSNNSLSPLPGCRAPQTSPYECSSDSGKVPSSPNHGRSPNGLHQGPHPFFLTPSAIYGGLGLLKPSLLTLSSPVKSGHTALMEETSHLTTVSTTSSTSDKSKVSDKRGSVDKVKREDGCKRSRPSDYSPDHRGFWDLLAFSHPQTVEYLRKAVGASPPLQLPTKGSTNNNSVSSLSPPSPHHRFIQSNMFKVSSAQQENLFNLMKATTSTGNSHSHPRPKSVRQLPYNPLHHPQRLHASEYPSSDHS